MRKGQKFCRDEDERQRRRKESQKARNARRRDKALPVVKAARQSWGQRLKKEVLAAYSVGFPACKCCGEQNLDFLTLDHLDNDGGEHRREAQGKRLHYLYLKQQGFPKDRRIVVMCWNCNCGRKANFGICPHYCQIDRTERYEMLKEGRDDPVPLIREEFQEWLLRR